MESLSVMRLSTDHTYSSRFYSSSERHHCRLVTALVNGLVTRRSSAWLLAYQVACPCVKAWHGDDWLVTSPV